MYTILIIEDEPRVASLLMNGLEKMAIRQWWLMTD